MLTPLAMQDASAESLEQSAPVWFSGRSNQPTSCLSIDSKAILRIRSVSRSADTVNIKICVKIGSDLCGFTCDVARHRSMD